MKCKKIMIILIMAICLFAMASVSASDVNDTVIASTGDSAVELSQADADEIMSTDENELIGQTDNELISEGDRGTFAELQANISQATEGSTITLNKNYECEDGFDSGGILIDRPITIDGQGNKIDAQGKSRIFRITAENVVLKNIIFTNGKSTGTGGAVHFSSEGTVTNCNFTGNKAINDGGAIWMSSGSVENCNFTDNKATGSNSRGGAVHFLNTGTVSNCNFADNSASHGGAIFSNNWYTAVDTCIFKRNSGDNVNTVIYPPTLNVDNFTTFYGFGEKLTFNLTTNSGMPVNNGNISISVYFKDNNSWVRNYSCLSGEGWTISLPVGSYYANFTTEYAGFEAISRTIKIIPNIPYYVNVTPVTTNNRTVNITAKSNIPQDIMEGKLLFILPNGANITANYAGNGTWWAEHTFDAYDVYQVNVTYVGLDNVTVNNGTISISKTPTNITVVNTTVNLFVLDSVATGAALTPADAGNLTFTSSNYSVAKVENGYIIAVGGGTAIITVSFAGSEDYAAAENKTITVNVIKYDSKVTISQINDTDYPNNVTVEYSIENRTNVSITIDGVPQDKIIITNDTITVIGLDAGEYTITIINNESDLYYKSNDTKTFTVNPLSTSIAASDISTTYNINKDLVITLKDSKGEALSGVKVTVNLKGTKTYTTDKNGQIKINVAKLVPKVYTAKVTFDGNTNYAKSTADVKVTVKKAKPKIIAKKKTYKAKKKTKKFTITLKDNKGKPIKKVKVRLIVQKIKKTSKNKNKKSKKNKRKNIVKTNKKGKATFKINRYKKGKYLATVKFYGNKYYAKTVKKVKINLK